MEQLKVALIGCGKVAEKHLKAIRTFPEALRLVALADSRPESAHRLMQALGFSAALKAAIPVYEDYRTMLEKERPDLVAITTPSGTHFAMGMAALAAGAHLVMEKPLTLSVPEADALVREAAARQRRIAVGHIYRYFPLVSTLAEEIRSGRHGRVLFGQVTVRWGHDQAYYDQAAWRGTYAQDGGAVMNQCIHALDLMTFLMGSGIVSARADIDRLTHRMEAEDFGLAVLKLENGAWLGFQGTTVTDPKRQEASFEVVTERLEFRGGILAGKIRLSIRERGGRSLAFAYLRRLLAARWRDGGLAGLRMLFHPHTEIYRDLIRALAENRSPLADGQSGRDAVESVLLIYKAASTGCEARRPVAPFSVADMAGYFDRPATRED